MSRAGKTIVATTRVVLFLIAGALLSGAGGLVWLSGNLRNPDGFLTGPTAPMTTAGHAITSSSIDIDGVPEDWLTGDVVGTFQTEVESADGEPLFIGVGPSEQVDAFLDEVAHTEVTRFGSELRISFEEHPGSLQPGLPGDQDFWMASADGNGSLTMEWEPVSASWTLVVMNADATPTVDVEASTGLDSPWILAGTIALGILGLATIAVATGLALIGSARPHPQVIDRRRPKEVPV
jgi:hypothetical protein